MIIIGVDFRPEFQQIAFVDTETGELEERRLHHPDEAAAFYRALVSQGKTVRVGMEASGHGRWIERLMGRTEFRSERITRRAVVGWAGVFQLERSGALFKADADLRS